MADDDDDGFCTTATATSQKEPLSQQDVPVFTNLADYLDRNTAITPKHVFLSDTSLEEIQSNFGYLPLPAPPIDNSTTQARYDSIDPSLEDVLSWHDRRDIDMTDEEEDIRSHNRKLHRRIARAVRDLPNAISRILDRISPTVETFSFLLYIAPDYEKDFGGGIDWNRLFLKADDEGVDNDYISSPTLKYDFPNLRALSLRNSLRLTQFKDFGNPQLAVAPDFPLFLNVTHLHYMHIDDTHRRFGLPSFEQILSRLPSLTHVRFTGAYPQLRKHLPYNDPVSLRNWLPIYWYDDFLRNIGVALPEPLRLVPENLTVIIHPTFYPEPSGFCATNQIEYDSRIEGLIKNTDIHLSWPVKEDLERFSYGYQLVPVDRAIEHFKEFARGGEGDWAIPDKGEAEKPFTEWWW
ncbi:hypothetical protein VNI00_010028 [Paramarasmius palmivorus]|uniref:Uncharacterized protein n=1 Tax=Paramarasmius palmivorus TaxID=297713 RepID=A0AAW0CP02_9AGAR